MKFSRLLTAFALVGSTGCWSGTQAPAPEKPAEPVHVVTISYNGTEERLPDILNRFGLFPECNKDAPREKNPSEKAKTYCTEIFAASQEQDTAKEKVEQTYKAAMTEVEKLRAADKEKEDAFLGKIIDSVDPLLPCKAHDAEIGKRIQEMDAERPANPNPATEARENAASRQRSEADRAANSAYYAKMVGSQAKYLDIQPGKTAVTVTRTVEVNYEIY